MWTYNYTDELYHHGILGMKWGVRRYQNADGSLTKAGQKRYSSMSDNKLQKELYKQVKKERSRQTDWSNQWNVNNTIGKNSKKASDKYWNDRKEYENSEQYKKAMTKLKSLDKKFDKGNIDPDSYDSEYEKILTTVYKPELDSSVRIGSKGREYTKEYLDTYGKDLNISYLKDLGYNDKTAREFTDRILNANKKLLNGM